MHKVTNSLPASLTRLLVPLPILMTISMAPVHAQHDGPGDPAEHEAILALVADQDVTVASVQSGHWKHASTWGGVVPSTGDRVLVSPGHVVKLNSMESETLATVRVDGELWFGPGRDSQLKVDTLVVNVNGRLRMGKSLNRPLRAHKTARIVIEDLNGGFETVDALSPDYDPRKLGQGLISLGELDVYGAPKTPFVTVDGALVGETVLVPNQQATGWRVGDSVVIAGTSDDANGDEVRGIVAIDELSGAITLDAPLGKNHTTPNHVKPGLVLGVHVGNLTRNVVIETAEANRGDLELRGHVMAMHTNDVHVHGLGLIGLGRTDKLHIISNTIYDDDGNIMKIGTNPRARYAFHFHQAGYQTGPAVVEDSVVVNSPGWGFVNHSSNVDFVSNVAYDVTGASFVTENGDEDGSFVGNLSVRTHGASGVSHQSKKFQFGHRGDGFWFQGLAVHARGNIASGATGHAFGIWGASINNKLEVWNETQQFWAYPSASGHHKFPAAILDDPTPYANTGELRLEDFPFEEFADNMAYGNSDKGLFVASHSPHDRADGRTLIERFIVFNTKVTHIQTYSGGTIVRDVTYVRGTANFQGQGLDMGHKRPGTMRIENAHIEGFNEAMRINDKGSNAISGGYLDAITGIRVIVRNGPGTVIESMPVFGPNVENPIVGPYQTP